MATFFKHRFEQKKKDRSLWVVTAIVAVLLFGDWMTDGTVRDTVRGIFSSISYGAKSFVLTIAESGLFASKTQIAKENTKLRAQITDLDARASAYDVIKIENEKLRALANLATTTIGTTSEVISRKQGLPYSSFMISSGKNSGIAVGDLVTVASGFVVGRVVDVGGESALVKDIFASGSKIAAAIGDSAMELEGRGSGNARGKIARSSKVTIGDPVRSAEYGNRAIGRVGKVLVDQAGSYQDILVEQGVNFSTLQLVYVVSAE